ncbi:MAG: lipoprotein [Pseudomonadota bacterium]
MKPLALILIAALAVSACGRKGDPITPQSDEAKQEQPSG